MISRVLKLMQVLAGTKALTRIVLYHITEVAVHRTDPVDILNKAVCHVRSLLTTVALKHTHHSMAPPSPHPSNCRGDRPNT